MAAASSSQSYKIPSQQQVHIIGDDPYRILDVPRKSTDREIRKCFKKLAKTSHPDKGGDTEAFKVILWAYEELQDPSKKRKWQNENGFWGGKGKTFDPYNGDDPTPPNSGDEGGGRPYHGPGYGPRTSGEPFGPKTGDGFWSGSEDDDFFGFGRANFKFERRGGKDYDEKGAKKTGPGGEYFRHRSKQEESKREKERKKRKRRKENARRRQEEASKTAGSKTSGSKDGSKSKSHDDSYFSDSAEREHWHMSDEDSEEEFQRKARRAQKNRDNLNDFWSDDSESMDDHRFRNMMNRFRRKEELREDWGKQQDEWRKRMEEEERRREAEESDMKGFQAGWAEDREKEWDRERAEYRETFFREKMENMKSGIGGVGNSTRSVAGNSEGIPSLREIDEALASSDGSDSNLKALKKKRKKEKKAAKKREKKSKKREERREEKLQKLRESLSGKIHDLKRGYSPMKRKRRKIEVVELSSSSENDKKKVKEELGGENEENEVQIINPPRRKFRKPVEVVDLVSETEDVKAEPETSEEDIDFLDPMVYKSPKKRRLDFKVVRKAPKNSHSPKPIDMKEVFNDDLSDEHSDLADDDDQSPGLKMRKEISEEKEFASPRSRSRSLHSSISRRNDAERLDSPKEEPESKTSEKQPPRSKAEKFRNHNLFSNYDSYCDFIDAEFWARGGNMGKKSRGKDKTIAENSDHGENVGQNTTESENRVRRRFAIIQPNAVECFVKLSLRKSIDKAEYLPRVFADYGVSGVYKCVEVPQRDMERLDSHTLRKVSRKNPLHFFCLQALSPDESLEKNTDVLLKVVNVGHALQLAIYFHGWDEYASLLDSEKNVFRAIRLIRAPVEVIRASETSGAVCAFQKSKTVLLVTRARLETL